MANPTHPGDRLPDIKDVVGHLSQPPADAPPHGLTQSVRSSPQARGENLDAGASPSASPAWFETRNAQMKQVLDAAYRAALTSAPILLTGEPGVGKSVLARQIHEWSRWRRQSFILVDCASISEHLPEDAPLDRVTAWLVGSSRDGGRAETVAESTIFFDHISELSELGQAGLLRFLEEQNFQSVFEQGPARTLHRIIAACNRDLAAQAAARRFREDLFFRISLISLELPPLRDRVEDLVPLATYLLSRIALAAGRPELHLLPGAVGVLTRYRWPGNVRQLGETLERAAGLTRGNAIASSQLSKAIANKKAASFGARSSI